jgi:MFS family permease
MNAVCFTGVNSAGARTAPPEALGITAGIVQTLIRIGGAIGAALGVALVGDIGPEARARAFRPSFLGLAAAGIVAALAAMPLATAARAVRAQVTAAPAETGGTAAGR